MWGNSIQYTENAANTVHCMDFDEYEEYDDQIPKTNQNTQILERGGFAFFFYASASSLLSLVPHLGIFGISCCVLFEQFRISWVLTHWWQEEADYSSTNFQK